MNGMTYTPTTKHNKTKSLQFNSYSNILININSNLSSYNKKDVQHLSQTRTIYHKTRKSFNDSPFENVIPFEDYQNKLKSIMEDYKYDGINLKPNKKLQESQWSNKTRTKLHKTHLFTPEKSMITINIKDDNFINPKNSHDVLENNQHIYTNVIKNYKIREVSKLNDAIKEISKSKKDIRETSRIKVTSLIPMNLDTNNPNSENLKADLNFLVPDSNMLIYDKEKSKTDMYAYFIYGKQNFPEGREQATWCTDGTDFLLFGGILSDYKNNSIWNFDPNKVEWSVVNKKDSPLTSFNRYGHTAIINNNKLILFGGKRKVNNYTFLTGLEIYFLQENTWYTPERNASDIHKLRKNHVAVTIGNKMLIHGGIGENEEYLNDIYLLNLNDFKWVNANIVEGGPHLAWHTCCLVLPYDQFNHPKLNIYKLPEQNHKNLCKIKEKGLYFFGGRNNNGLNNELWLLVIGKKPLEWVKVSTAGKPPAPRCGHSMNFYEPGNFLVVHGGRNDYNSDNFAINDTYLFELARFEWIRVNIYFEGKLQPFQRCYHSSLIFSNKLLIFGGMNSNNYIGSSLFLIDLDSHGKPPKNTSEFENILKKMYKPRKNEPNRRPISNSSGNVLLPSIK